jgi:uncharacterized protein (TIGR02246 family)
MAVMSLANEPALSAQDQAQIQALFEKTKAAWSSNDADLYASAFAADADYVGFDGACARGAQAIARSHQALFDGPLKGSRLFGAIETIRAVAPETAVVIATGAATLPWQATPSPARQSRQTYVAAKIDGAWRFVSFHNTRIRPMPGPVKWLFAAMGWAANRLGRADESTRGVS